MEQRPLVVSSDTTLSKWRLKIWETRILWGRQGFLSPGATERHGKGVGPLANDSGPHFSHSMSPGRLQSGHCEGEGHWPGPHMLRALPEGHSLSATGLVVVH